MIAWPWLRASVLAAGVLCLALTTGRAGAQERFVVEGRVVVGSTGMGVGGLGVALTGRPPVLTDTAGRFRIPEVPPGLYTLVALGFGYTSAELPLRVTADTTVVVEVEVAPFVLDTLGVEAERLDEEVDVRGEVRDAELDAWLYEARVYGTPDLEDTTDPIGRFDLGEVPTLVPLTVRVESFGFLTESATFEPRRDTTLRFALEPDPVARRMIEREMERTDRRAEGRRYEPLPVLDRDDLMRRHSGPILEVLRLRLGSYNFRRIACFVVDERGINDWRLESWRIDSIHVDQIQRVEVLVMPLIEEPLAVRIYTRDFVQDMVRGQEELVERRPAMERLAGRCR